MIKIALIAIGSVLLAVMLKHNKSDFSMYISLAAVIILFFCCLYKIETIIGYINRFQSLVTVKSEYLKILLKMTGIAYVAEISSSICKDCGYTSVAGQVEMFGKLSVVAVGMPIVMALIDTIGRIV